jgi:hypothetical protein
VFWIAVEQGTQDCLGPTAYLAGQCPIDVHGDLAGAYAGKVRHHGGNPPALMRPDGLPIWISGVSPGGVRDLARDGSGCMPYRRIWIAQSRRRRTTG